MFFKVLWSWPFPLYLSSSITTYTSINFIPSLPLLSLYILCTAMVVVVIMRSCFTEATHSLCVSPHLISPHPHYNFPLTISLQWPVSSQRICLQFFGAVVQYHSPSTFLWVNFTTTFNCPPCTSLHSSFTCFSACTGILSVQNVHVHV